MSNALPLSMSKMNVPAAPSSRPRSIGAVTPSLSRGPGPMAIGAMGRPAVFGEPRPMPFFRITPPPIPLTMAERMTLARERIRAAAEAGQRMRSYEVALDLDLSEFHFARQFRAAWGRSPHVYFDEIRAVRARAFLRDGVAESEVARRIGFRRPAELRALLLKRAELAAP